ncbi:MAG: hypothetical protein JST90_14625 [Bacteroidetes bacterium]|nr:hypothetical protein [Bacteroidota bacterium]
MAKSQNASKFSSTAVNSTLTVISIIVTVISLYAAWSAKEYRDEVKILINSTTDNRNANQSSTTGPARSNTSSNISGNGTSGQGSGSGGLNQVKGDHNTIVNNRDVNTQNFNAEK